VELASLRMEIPCIARLEWARLVLRLCFDAGCFPDRHYSADAPIGTASIGDFDPGQPENVQLLRVELAHRLRQFTDNGTALVDASFLRFLSGEAVDAVLWDRLVSSLSARERVAVVTFLRFCAYGGLDSRELCDNALLALYYWAALIDSEPDDPWAATLDQPEHVEILRDLVFSSFPAVTVTQSPLGATADAAEHEWHSAILKGREWRQLDKDSLMRIRWAFAAGQFTPDAFAAYLPAFLTEAIDAKDADNDYVLLEAIANHCSDIPHVLSERLRAVVYLVLIAMERAPIGDSCHGIARARECVALGIKGS